MHTKGIGSVIICNKEGKDDSRYIKLIIQDITEHEAMKQKLQDEVHQESKLRRENEYLMMQQSRMASMGRVYWMKIKSCFIRLTKSR
jgi:hypothetical protein